MTEQELKEIEDRASLPAQLLSGRELQLMADIKALVAEVRRVRKAKNPPYQTGA